MSAPKPKPKPKPTTDADRKLLADVESHGWHVVCVQSEDESAGWAFTVGLHHTLGHPEIAIFGLTTDLMHAVLNNLADDVRAGQRYEAGAVCEDVLEGVACTFKDVLPRWYRAFLGYAMWFYQGADFPVLQCIWPDKARNFPWDAAFNQEWADLQPFLFHESIDASLTRPWLKSMGIEREFTP